MSEQENNAEFDSEDTQQLKPDGQSSLSNRLASLRASIRASKAREAEGDESGDPRPDEAAAESEADEEYDEAETAVLDQSETAVLDASEAPETEEPPAPEGEDDEEPAATTASDEALEAGGEEEEEGEELPADDAPTAVAEPEKVNTPAMPMSAVDWSDEEFDSATPAGLVAHSSVAADDEEEPEEATEAPEDEERGDSLGFEEASQAAEAAEALQADDDADEDDEKYDVEPTVVKNLDDFSDVQGTPLYMSPEQCRSDSDLGPATDVYALGVMLFELLEGHAPYMGHTVDEVLVKHQDAPIPDQKSAFTPDDVQALISRMLAKSPDERPTTAEIIEVLQDHVQIGGPDVRGLEEESWSVDEIIAEDEEEEGDDGAAPVTQFRHPVTAESSAVDHTDEVEDRAGGMPIGLIAAVVIGVVVIAGIAVWMSGGEETEEPTDPTAVATKTDEPADEPDEQPPADEPAEDPGSGMVFGETNGGEEAPPDISGQIAAARAELGGGIADASTASEKAADELEAEQRKKRKRKKRKKKKLREIRLDL